MSNLDQPGQSIPMKSSAGRLTGAMKEDAILKALRTTFFVDGATAMEIAAEIPSMDLSHIVRILTAMSKADPAMVTGDWHGDPDGKTNTLHFKVWQLTAQGKERVDAGT